MEHALEEDGALTYLRLLEGISNQFLSTLEHPARHCGTKQKQPSRDVLIKRCSENIQQIYKKTLMPKCDFNKVALQRYLNRTSAWVFSCKFAAYFLNSFS